MLELGTEPFDAVMQDINSTPLLLEHTLLMPASKILFSAIDTLAYLNLDANETTNNKKHFMSFYDKYIKQYMAQNSGLVQSKLASTMVYGYRCGLLHASIFESSIGSSLNPEKTLIMPGENADYHKKPIHAYSEQIRKQKRTFRKHFSVPSRGLQSRPIGSMTVLNVYSFRYAIYRGMKDFVKDISSFSKEKQEAIQRRVKEMPNSVYDL